jgi:hypothetical protein
LEINHSGNLTFHVPLTCVYGNFLNLPSESVILNIIAAKSEDKVNEVNTIQNHLEILFLEFLASIPKLIIHATC